MNKWILLITLVSYPFISQAQTIYKWVDEEGVTHFGDLPLNQETTPVDVHVKHPDPAPTEAKPATTPVKSQKIAQNHPEIIMYGAAWCGVCRSARQYLSENGIKYKEYDIDTSSKGKRDYKNMKGTGVPIFLIDGERYNGFSASRFDKLLTN